MKNMHKFRYLKGCDCNVMEVGQKKQKCLSNKQNMDFCLLSHIDINVSLS